MAYYLNTDNIIDARGGRKLLTTRGQLVGRIEKTDDGKFQYIPGLSEHPNGRQSDTAPLWSRRATAPYRNELLVIGALNARIRLAHLDGVEV